MGGQTSTHVANAYKEDIWVKVDAERAYITMANVGTSVGLSNEGDSLNMSIGEKYSLDWYKVKGQGFTRIGPGKFFKFDVEMGPGKNTAYITIFTNSGRVICDGLQQKEDYSVIVSADGYIVDTAYGKLWQDTSGQYHCYESDQNEIKNS